MYFVQAKLPFKVTSITPCVNLLGGSKGPGKEYVVILQHVNIAKSFIQSHPTPRFVSYIPTTSSSRFGRPALDVLQKSFGITRGTVVEPDQYSIDVPMHLIRTMTTHGDTVISICAGVGTDSVACMMLGRNAVSFEKSLSCFSAIKSRHTDAKEALTRAWSASYAIAINRKRDDYRNEMSAKGETIPDLAPPMLVEEEKPEEAPVFDAELGTVVAPEPASVRADKEEVLKLVKTVPTIKARLDVMPGLDVTLEDHILEQQASAIPVLSKLVKDALDITSMDADAHIAQNAMNDLLFKVLARHKEKQQLEIQQQVEQPAPGLEVQPAQADAAVEEMEE